MTVMPDPVLAGQRMSEDYQRNIGRMGTRDVLVASCGGAGQSYVGNILHELSVNYVDAYTEELREDGTAVARTEHGGYRKHLASLHDKDNTAPPVEPWPRLVKTHHPPEMFPDGSFGAVWLLVRDPRDALYSLYQWRHNFAEEEWDRVPPTFEGWLRGRGDFTASPVDDWTAFHQAWLRRTPDCTVLRFEDLKRDPEGALTEPLRRLGVRFDEARLRRAADNSSFDKMRAHEDAVSATGEPRMIRDGRVAGWQRWMTPELAGFFRDDELRAVAGKFGYDLD